MDLMTMKYLMHVVFFFFTRQYRGNEGQMRELQDQLEAEQYFSVSKSLSSHISAFLIRCESHRLKLSVFPPFFRRFTKLRSRN